MNSRPKLSEKIEQALQVQKFERRKGGSFCSVLPDRVLAGPMEQEHMDGISSRGSRTGWLGRFFHLFMKKKASRFIKPNPTRGNTTVLALRVWCVSEAWLSLDQMN